MTAQDQFLAVILLWIMAPFLIIAVLLAPLALVTMLEHGRRAQHGQTPP